jgi:50S ribosomal subunit-associated GTPase HflX
LIEIQPPVERALLVAAPRRGTPDARYAQEHLDELARLADTAGAFVVGRTIQRVEAPTPAYYVGRGKVLELKALADSLGASLVVFDEELSPVQGKNLERVLERRVMDRAELILDIFATRARTKEAKMQVELAQLEYLLPRLARMWVHLSRIRGGIGLRGPGETQLETDRRIIRRKIATLKRKLEDVAQHREILRRGRRPVLTAALVGYTNAGKSSLLKAFSGAEVFIEDRLFATLDTLTREVVLNGDSRATPSPPANGDSRAAPSPANGDGRAAARSPENSGAEMPTGLRSEPGGLPSRERAAREAAGQTQNVRPGAQASASGEGRPRRVRLVDTVGFIRKLPHHLVASFRATLEEVREADVLIHVIDASHHEWEEQLKVVDRVLADLEIDSKPVIHAFNKMDLVPEPDLFRHRAAAAYENAVFISAARGEIGELETLLSRMARSAAATG